jgi:predicted O-methyltransferase YrrM
LSDVPHTEDHITADPVRAARQYAEGFVPEDDVLARARERAHELGCEPVTPGAGALLAVLTATLGARAVVEVGTCAGVAALWLLRGMPADGVLTTIDPHGDHLRAARLAFAEAGLPPGRTRSITSRADEVLPRLADGAYDLVLIGGEPHAWFDYAVEALRLLRAGGLLVVDGALQHGLVTDPAAQDEATAAARELAGSVLADRHLVPALVPVGDGLLLAVKQA